MSRNVRKDSSGTKVELKYCEHCGGLWVRESGAGVYCAKCEPKVAELPTPKKRPGRLMLPEQTKSVVEDYGPGSEPPTDIDAAGGAA